jgi:serine/threonine-protein kinase
MAQVQRVVADVCQGLDCAHAQRIIHRDLKPANVMVDRRDGRDHVKVLDFGIATLTEGDVEARLTQQGTVFGTPAYMSPEQIRGEALDPRSDLYAVGVILYEILSGRLPFESTTPLGLAAKHLTETPPALAEARPGLAASPALEALVRLALAKEPAARPASSEAFRTALLACPVAAEVGGAGPSSLAPTAPLNAAEVKRVARVTTAPIPAARPRRRRRLAWGLGAALVAALIAGALATPLATSVPSSPTPSPIPSPNPTPTPTPPPSPPPAPPPNPLPVPPPKPSPTKPLRPPRPPPEPAPAPRSVISATRPELNSLPVPPADSGDGLLAIEASPWALVTVDGQELGETPREIQITAGRHRLRAVHPELGVREGIAVVEAGKRQVWVAKLER